MVTGPHAGVRSDIEIFRGAKPPLDHNELGLGDKAYYGDDDVEPPFKKPKGGELTAYQENYNIVHRLAFNVVVSFTKCKQLVESDGGTCNLANEKVCDSWRSDSRLFSVISVVVVVVDRGVSRQSVVRSVVSRSLAHYHYPYRAIANFGVSAASSL